MYSDGLWTDPVFDVTASPVPPRHARAAKTKRPVPDAPTQVPMRPKAAGQHAVSTDQKKERRQMSRAVSKGVMRKSATFVEGEPVLLNGGDPASYIGQSWFGTMAPQGMVFVEVDGDIAAVPDTIITKAGAREGADKESAMSQPTEAQILAAMAKATPQERRRLTTMLDDQRAERRAAIQERRDLDLASTVVRAHLTPVAVHERDTAETDWLGSLATPSGDPTIAMKTAATKWYRSVSAEVKADSEEFAVQAAGRAGREAGRFGENAAMAHRAFLDHVAHLDKTEGHKVESNAQSGDADSGLEQIVDSTTVVDPTPAFEETGWDQTPDGTAPPAQGYAAARKRGGVVGTMIPANQVALGDDVFVTSTFGILSDGDIAAGTVTDVGVTPDGDLVLYITRTNGDGKTVTWEPYSSWAQVQKVSARKQADFLAPLRSPNLTGIEVYRNDQGNLVAVGWIDDNPVTQVVPISAVSDLAPLGVHFEATSDGDDYWADLTTQQVISSRHQAGAPAGLQQTVDTLNVEQYGFAGSPGFARDDDLAESQRDYDIGFYGHDLGLIREPGFSYALQLGYDDADDGKPYGTSFDAEWKNADDGLDDFEAARKQAGSQDDLFAAADAAYEREDRGWFSALSTSALETLWASVTGPNLYQPRGGWDDEVYDALADRGWFEGNGVDAPGGPKDIWSNASRKQAVRLGEQAACAKCDLDIEYVGQEYGGLADPGNGWWDRGGNFSCPQGGFHEPYDPDGRFASRHTADEVNGPVDAQNGLANSGLPEVDVYTDTTPAFDDDAGLDLTEPGQDAADVASVPTPGDANPYPRPKGAARRTAVSLNHVGIDKDGNGVGTDPSGARVKFRLTDSERAELKSVLLGDLAINFSGVDVDQGDIIGPEDAPGFLASASGSRKQGDYYTSPNGKSERHGPYELIVWQAADGEWGYDVILGSGASTRGPAWKTEDEARAAGLAQLSWYDDSGVAPMRQLGSRTAAFRARVQAGLRKAAGLEEEQFAALSGGPVEVYKWDTGEVLATLPNPDAAWKWLFDHSIGSVNAAIENQGMFVRDAQS